MHILHKGLSVENWWNVSHVSRHSKAKLLQNINQWSKTRPGRCKRCTTTLVWPKSNVPPFLEELEKACICSHRCVKELGSAACSTACCGDITPVPLSKWIKRLKTNIMLRVLLASPKAPQWGFIPSKNVTDSGKLPLKQTQISKANFCVFNRISVCKICSGQSVTYKY